MTTETNGDNARLARLTANIARMEELTRRLASALTDARTALHLDRLSEFGPSPAHRRSFAPVREAAAKFGVMS